MKYGENISVVEKKDGFWLYDETQGMNLSMCAKSKDEAFVEALRYYQGRVANLEAGLKTSNFKMQQILDVLGAEEINEDDKEFIRNYR